MVDIMKCPANYRVCCLALFAVLIPEHLKAQSPACRQAPALESDSTPEIKVNIVRFEFPQDFPLSDVTMSKLEKDIRNEYLITGPDIPDPEWWEDRVDLPIRE